MNNVLIMILIYDFIYSFIPRMCKCVNNINENPSLSRNEQSQLLAILNNYFFIIIPKEIKLKNICKIFFNILPKKKLKIVLSSNSSC